MKMKSARIQQRLKRSPNKCEACNKTFASAAALVSHLKAVHSSRLKSSKVKQSQKKGANAKLSEVKKSTITVKNLSPTELPPKPAEKTKETAEEILLKIDDRPRIEKMEFQCPKCMNYYRTYYSAVAHIEDKHCVNSDGTPVPRGSSEMIKPIRLDSCLRCFSDIKSDGLHKCAINAEYLILPDAQTFHCKGCKEDFPTLKKYKYHLPVTHASDMLSLFFTNSKDLVQWRADLEKQIDCKYQAMFHNREILYSCSHLRYNQKHKAINFCPSTILFEKFPKGTQALFYKKHCHPSKSYILKDYHKNNIMYKMFTTVNEEKVVPTYVKFKTIMNEIIAEAAKLNEENIQIILKKAEEMSNLVAEYSKEVKTSNGAVTPEVKVAKTPKLTDKQICDVLEEVNDQLQVIAGENLNKSENVNKTENNVMKPKNIIPQTASFNDSYKEFISKAEVSKQKLPPVNNKKKLDTSANKTPVKRLVKEKKSVMKTKMGQFIPNSPKRAKLSTDIESPRSNTSSTVSVDLKYEVKEQENDCNILILKI